MLFLKKKKKKKNINMFSFNISSKSFTTQCYRVLGFHQQGLKKKKIIIKNCNILIIKGENLG